MILPDSDRGSCVAYQIVEKGLGRGGGKPAISVSMPMTSGKPAWLRAIRRRRQPLRGSWTAGRTWYFTLGDPTVYSTTYLYVHKRVLADGYEAEIVPGVPSFCAAAARLGQSLGEGAEMIHIVPSSHGVERGLDLPGVKILMKAGSKMGRVKELLLERDMEVSMVEKLWHGHGRCFRSAAEIPRTLDISPCSLPGRKERTDDSFCRRRFRRSGLDYGRGQRLLSQADLIIYAGSLVNPALLEGAKPGCQVMDSARMTLEEVLEAMLEAERTGRMTVRLHTGDPWGHPGADGPAGPGGDFL